ncbi:hypothetical protein Mal64_35840 [Pseudobythopirellula maris]|uniref:Uncharacterized protein n=1 Tax=Pseudobythopirellula maris TaxID=2527991 RepID=A0A5C5ZHD9_9BACT|nr:hypothetical protein Mal64_35840 [Pseudobythopirellula maris]
MASRIEISEAPRVLWAHNVQDSCDVYVTTTKEA